jgi:hypothetical protein
MWASLSVGRAIVVKYGSRPSICDGIKTPAVIKPVLASKPQMPRGHWRATQNKTANSYMIEIAI